jgi:hypothetical protein
LTLLTRSLSAFSGVRELARDTGGVRHSVTPCLRPFLKTQPEHHLQSVEKGTTWKGDFVKSVQNDRLREKLDLLREVAPEKIVAMYQKIVLHSGRGTPIRPRSFNHMIDVIIAYGDDELLELSATR